VWEGLRLAHSGCGCVARVEAGAQQCGCVGRVEAGAQRVWVCGKG